MDVWASKLEADARVICRNYESRIEAQAKEIAELKAALQAILIADTGVVEGSSNKPVLCYGLCAGMVKDQVNLSREETLRLVRAKPRP